MPSASPELLRWAGPCGPASISWLPPLLAFPVAAVQTRDWPVIVGAMLTAFVVGLAVDKLLGDLFRRRLGVGRLPKPDQHLVDEVRSGQPEAAVVLGRFHVLPHGGTWSCRLVVGRRSWLEIAGHTYDPGARGRRGDELSGRRELDAEDAALCRALLQGSFEWSPSGVKDGVQTSLLVSRSPSSACQCQGNLAGADGSSAAPALGRLMLHYGLEELGILQMWGAASSVGRISVGRYGGAS